MPFSRENPLSPGRQDPGLAELMKITKRATEMGIRVQVPATVTAFNPTTHRCQLNVGFLPVRYTSSGEVVQQTPINLTNIPVEFPGAGGKFIQFPINAGTTGMMTVCDRSMERWSKNGIPADPALRKVHSLIDGVFRPGARPKTGATLVDGTALVIESDTFVKLGAAATSPAVLGLEHATAFATYNTAIVAAFSAWAAIFPSTSIDNLALSAAIAGASSGLQTDITTSLSGKVLVE